jgi:hypothetical protein
MSAIYYNNSISFSGGYRKKMGPTQITVSPPSAASNRTESNVKERQEKNEGKSGGANVTVTDKLMVGGLYTELDIS